MERLGLLFRQRLAVGADSRHGFNRHGIRNRVLHHITGWCQQAAHHEPGFHTQQLTHCLGVHDECVHDAEARCDQRGPEIDQECLPAPNQINQVAEWHFQRPRQPSPESERGEKRGRKPEVLLDKKRADDGGQPGNPGREIDHQRRQKRPAQLPKDVNERSLEPLLRRRQHASDFVSVAIRWGSLSLRRIIRTVFLKYASPLIKL